MGFKWRVAGISLISLPLLAGLGCTGSNVLPPSNGQLVLEVLVDPAAGERPEPKPPFLWFKAEVAALTYHSVDPLAPVSFGTSPLQLVSSPTKVDFVGEGAQAVSTVTFTAGTYEVDGLFVNKFELNTTPLAPVLGYDRCAGEGENAFLLYATVLVAGNNAKIIPANRPRFTIRSDAPTTLRVVVDGAQLTPLLEGQAACGAGNVATVTPVDPALLGPLFSVELP